MTEENAARPPRGDRPDKEHVRKKEHERHRHKARTHSSRHRAYVDDDDLLPPPNTRLHRDTNFVCRIKFSNTLPIATGECKLLPLEFDKERFTRYQPTTLEKNHKHELLVEPDLGIPVDLLNPQAYAINTEDVPELHPDDARLLKDDDTGEEDEAGSRYASGVDLPWLMRTQYISNDLQTKKQKGGMSEKKYKAMKQQQEEEQRRRKRGTSTNAGVRLLGSDDEDDDGMYEPEDEKQKQIDMIEASFLAAQQTPKHATRPELTPVEILPILPDFERMDKSYAYVLFDSDPAKESNQYCTLRGDAAELLAKESLLKSFNRSGPTGDDTGDKFVTYMLPKEWTKEKADAESQVAGIPVSKTQAQEYEWVREYSFDVKRDEDVKRDTLVLWYTEHAVRYANVGLRLTLTKKRALAGEAEIARPSKVLVLWGGEGELDRVRTDAPAVDDVDAERNRDGQNTEGPPGDQQGNVELERGTGSDLGDEKADPSEPQGDTGPKKQKGARHLVNSDSDE
mmetsp:Transcript_3432/g.12374  ORF Transcript_3432/g.12374 Transcript_3432/m.12374 type:complete len:510 (-) Transcript_3432:806-2335(-)